MVLRLEKEQALTCSWSSVCLCYPAEARIQTGGGPAGCSDSGG